MNTVERTLCPDFDEAVRLHRFIDSIQEASDQSREVAVR